ncbi:MAG: endonuclease MutS2 [Spirochaetaceae bacterium]|nr:MAG: endonuclease MutS2 [Spirochaetaceae bacterium]
MSGDHGGAAVATHTIELLELELILEQLSDYCFSEGGARSALDPRFLDCPAEIESTLDRVGEWRQLLDAEDPTAGLSFPACEAFLPRLRIEGTLLEGEQLIATAQFVLSAVRLRDRLAHADNGGHLGARILISESLADTARRLASTLDNDGAVIEKSVPQLRTLGERIRATGRSLQRAAQALLSDERLRSAFSADVPTQKDGRIVLPVRANQRYRLGGVVYDVSQTGSTVYVEPPEILERNNQLRELNAAYQAEVTRVYRELSDALRRELAPLQQAVETVADVDLLYARARFARTHDCSRPLHDAECLELRQARHPLLGRSCVPMDITVPSGKRILIVTGPNTGGKTVALKTVGVLSLLYRLGMQLPVAEPSRLPLFAAVYADIGDEQSLQQSLSTFSAHMKNVGEILGAADQRSLVLLDELGAGTDPEEGGALAMAVVDRLVELRTTAVITTHHSALKHYGYTHGEVENAAVEFDRERLRPTFRLLIGVPGSSHALHIARRHGLPEATVAAAERYVGEQRSDAAAIIEELSRRGSELRNGEHDLQQRYRVLEDEARALRRREQLLAERELVMQREQQAAFERLVSETRKRLENLVRELRESELTRERTRAVKDFVHELDEHSARRAEEIRRTAREVERSGRRPAELTQGVRVRVLGSRREGIAVRRLRDGKWQVEVGSMRISVQPEQLEVVGPAVRPRTEIGVDIDTTHSGPAPVLELDLRGMRLDEALSAVRDQVERATRGGLHDFSVIHGMGSGVLQQGVRSLLAEYPNAEYRYARPEEGGYGKTVVHLNLD